MVVALLVPFTALDGLFAQQPGDLDSTFGIGGITLTHFGGFGQEEANSIAIQADGRILYGWVWIHDR